MVNIKKKFFSFVIILIFITPLLLSIFIVNSLLIWEKKEDDNTKLKLTQNENENITIEVEFSNLIWIEAQLTLTVETLPNISGELKIFFLEVASNKYFNVISQREEIDEDSKYTLQYSLNPYLTTVPGKYIFRVIINYYEEGSKSGIEIYDESFDATLGMGYLVLIMLTIIFGTAIIVVLTIKSEEIEKKPSGATSTSGIPDGKIKCPVCKKLVEEGLSFCPECGERIPDFLKFSTNPPSGL